MVSHVNRLKNFSEASKAFEDAYDHGDRLKTIDRKLGDDGKIDYVERKVVPTTLRAGDYSVQSVLDNAPELMNNKMLLSHNDKVRSVESLERELKDLSELKSAYDSLPRILPEDDNVDVELTKTE